MSLELVRAFHPYLFKYLDMILRGHLPVYGTRVNADAKNLLQYLMPKGTAVTRESLAKTCRYLHLAFKGYGAAEIYNVLTAVLLRVLSKYDPFYVDKVGDVIDVIKHKFGRVREFTAYQLNKELPFETRYIVRMLVKKGFLDQVSAGPKRLAYRRVKSMWPPPASFLNEGPIGLAHYVGKWLPRRRQEWRRTVSSSPEFLLRHFSPNDKQEDKYVYLAPVCAPAPPARRIEAHAGCACGASRSCIGGGRAVGAGRPPHGAESVAADRSGAPIGCY